MTHALTRLAAFIPLATTIDTHGMLALLIAVVVLGFLVYAVKRWVPLDPMMVTVLNFLVWIITIIIVVVAIVILLRFLNVNIV